MPFLLFTATMALITNTTTYDTPEGISLVLVPAGILPRAIAWLIDAIIRLLVLFGLTLASLTLGTLGFGLWLIIYFLVFWLYPVFFEVWRDGQTIGKRIMKLRVCMDNGMPIGVQASFIRNLLIIADFMPMAFFAGILSVLFNGQSKRIGDVVAGTMVVYDETNIQDFDVMVASPIVPPMPLTLNEQQAILNFVERKNTLSDERATELSNILSPLTKNKKDTLQEIIGYANAILGIDATTRTHKKGGN